MKFSILKTIFSKTKKKAEVSYVLGLVFLEKEVKCALIREENGRREMVGVAKADYEGDWDKALVAVDRVLSKVSGAVADEKIDEVILGVPSFWTVKGKILKEYLAKLRKICDELSLRPIGFVTVVESLVFWLQKKEGIPLTSIILGFLGERVEVSKVLAGKIEKTRVVKKEKDMVLGELVGEEFLKLKGNGVLSTRIILYGDEEDLTGIREDLISYPWVDKKIFMHFPKIEISEENADLSGLISSAGIKLTDEEFKEEKIEEKEAVVADKFGFVVGEDIVEERIKEEEEKKIKETEVREEKAEEGEEKTEKGMTLAEAEVKIEKDLGKKKNSIKEVVEKVRVMVLGILGRDILGDIFRKKLTVVGGGLAVFLGLAFGVWWYLPKATMVILVEPKVLEQESEVFITTLSSEVDEKTLLAEAVEVEEEGNETEATTGKKVVGEKAIGEVVVYNKTTTGEKKFSVGTPILYQGLKFLLDDDVTVASASAGLESVTFGKATVKVTAAEIGTEGNLAGGKTFRVSDYPDNLYSGYNSKAFSGGSSREIKVVSESDRIKLLKKLTSKLVKKGRKNLLGEKDDAEGKLLIDEGIETKVVEQKYSKASGDEARELTLSLKIKISGMAVDRKKLDKFIKVKINKDMPGGYKLKEGMVEAEVVEVGKEKKSKIPVTVHYKGFLIPEIDFEDLRDEIVGKKLEVVERYVEKLPSVVGFEVNISGLFKSHFPRVGKRIDIKVELYK